MTVDLGIIEGYFGRPWSWDERAAVMRRLGDAGYRFFIYAPKADAHLRRRWREPYPGEQAAAIAGFASSCRAAGVRFGVGLSPFEIYLGFDADARSALASKVAELDALGIEDLAILFDDMRGDLPGLAEIQAGVAHFAAAASRAGRVLVCPTYYSLDPVLDRAFGARPPDYLATLGRLLDPRIEIFWTGEEVCSREYSIAHLAEVAERLRRKPFLWDNYPVNDGARMSQYLHLRGFTGRPAGLAEYVAGHAINPALQPTLTCIPALTLAASYALGDRYSYGAETLRAAREVVGGRMASMLVEDMIALADAGLDRLGSRRERLLERYGSMSEPAAREVVGWLEGAYAISDEIVQTQ